MPFFNNVYIKGDNSTDAKAYIDKLSVYGGKIDDTTTKDASEPNDDYWFIHPNGYIRHTDNETVKSLLNNYYKLERL